MVRGVSPECVRRNKQGTAIAGRVINLLNNRFKRLARRDLYIDFVLPVHLDLDVRAEIDQFDHSKSPICDVMPWLL